MHTIDRCMPSCTIRWPFTPVQNLLKDLKETTDTCETWAQAVAPHLISVADCALLAVGSYCFVRGRPRKDRRDVHCISSPQCISLDSSIEVAINDFLNEMKVQKMYEIQVFFLDGIDEKFRTVTVLAAVWKMIGGCETEPVGHFQDPGKFARAVSKVHEKQGLDRKQLDASIRATIDETGDNLWFYVQENLGMKADDEDKSKIDVSLLRQKYEFVYLRLTLHADSDPSYQAQCFPQTADLLWEAVREEIEDIQDHQEASTSAVLTPNKFPSPNALANVLSSYFDSRMKHRERWTSDPTLETTIECVLSELHDAPRPLSDSHPCGTLLLIDKTTAEDVDINMMLRKIANKLYEYITCEEAINITFYIFNKAATATCLSGLGTDFLGIHETLNFSPSATHPDEVKLEEKVRLDVDCELNECSDSEDDNLSRTGAGAHGGDNDAMFNEESVKELSDDIENGNRENQLMTRYQKKDGYSSDQDVTHEEHEGPFDDSVLPLY